MDEHRAMLEPASPASRTRGAARAASALARDLLAGLVASVVLIANIVSFAALMFPGALAAGAPAALWAMLVGSGLSGLWIAWKTSLPPLATGIDSPTGAVLVALSASTAAAALAQGASTDAAVRSVMLLFSAATLVTGVVLLAIGVARRGALLRFVPAFVSAGFIGATGVTLLIGGVRMSAGVAPAALPAALTPEAGARLACALLVLAVLLGLKRFVKSTLALPLALLAMALIGSLVLHALGRAAPEQGWYLPSLGALQPWQPLAAMGAEPPSLAGSLAVLPELLAVAVVAVVSLVAKVSSIELARKTYGDLDTELRAHGLGTLAVVPFGGLVGSLQIGISRLLEHGGAATRGSGVACALVLLTVGLTGLDLPAVVPLPMAAGLVFYLGWGFLVEAFAKPLARRDAVSLGLILAIVLACVQWGYLVGVLGGIVLACALFAFQYARAGVVRRHLSRVQFAGHVARSPAAMRHLAEHGEAVQLYWLSGYLFFGSSEGLFERVRHDIAARPAHEVRFLVIDFDLVTGADASGAACLGKLRHHCQRQGITLVLAALPAPLRHMLEREGLVGAKDQVAPMADAHVALAWCEDRLLEQAFGDAAGCEAEDFEQWLQAQLGPGVAVRDVLPYLERRSFDGPTVLYRQGEAADAVDLVAAGSLVVDLVTDRGQTLRARRIMTHAAVGEMGLIRGGPRSATVSTGGPATVYTLRRERLEAMRRERPELAIAVVEFLLRTVADRLVVTERTVAALHP